MIYHKIRLVDSDALLMLFYILPCKSHLQSGVYLIAVSSIPSLPSLPIVSSGDEQMTMLTELQDMFKHICILTDNVSRACLCRGFGMVIDIQQTAVAFAFGTGSSWQSFSVGCHTFTNTTS